MSFNLSLFDQRPFPRTSSVVPSGQEGDDWEYDEVVRFYTGKRLSDVTYPALREQFRKDWTTAHHLMSDAAFVHFLPALMKMSLDPDLYETTPVGLLADDLVHTLLRMAKGEMDRRRVPLLEAYSREQLREVAFFLEEMSSQHYDVMGQQDQAAEALRLFWGQFASCS